MIKKKDETASTMKNLLSSSAEEKPTVTLKARGEPERKLYSATLRIPRPTAERMQQIAFDRKTTMQRIMALALDEWLRKENEGTFYPDGWDEDSK
jgi:hypothetical protein